MADAKRPPRPFFLFRPRVLLFCLYVFCYATLRYSGDIIQQVAERRIGGQVGREYIVASSLELPRWQRQLYRAAFSLPMVIEEEAMRTYAGDGGVFTDLFEYVRGLL